MTHVHNARKNPLRADPTRTALIRRRFQAEILRRMKALKGDVWEFLVTLDALGLKGGRTPGDVSTVLFPRNEVANDSHDENLTTLARPQPREYEFRTSAAKLKAFREWLEEQIEARVLSTVRGQDPNKPWTHQYIESAFKRGVVNAYVKSRTKDFVFDEAFFDSAQEKFLRGSFGSPEMLSKVELLATRTYEELRGVTSQMAQQMNRILAQGMADGRGVVDIARELSGTIDGITRKRALVIARTEVIRAHAEGQLDSFEALGVKELGVLAEWSTAGDNRVCPRCYAMEGKKFTLEDAQGAIPLHPNCRCAWIPYVPIPGEKVAKADKMPGKKKETVKKGKGKKK